MPYKDRSRKQKFQREWVRAKQKRSLDAGKCRSCHRQPRYSKLTTCLECSYKRFARQHLGSSERWGELRSLLSKQKNRCAYTGLPIDIGQNASIEHVQPVSKCPRRKTDVTNLKWVHREVNSMKRDMSLHDFLMMCKKILEHFNYDVIRDEAK